MINRDPMRERGTMARQVRRRGPAAAYPNDRLTPDAQARREKKHQGDLRLVQRALEGEGSAVALLSRRLQAVHRLAAMRAARYVFLGAASVEDVGQDALLQAWSSLDRYEGQSSLEGWLWGIVVHVMNAYQRRQIKEEDRRARLEADCRQEHEALEPAFDAPTRADASIRAALLSLSKVTREVLFARAVDGLSYEEIARRSRMTPRAARGRYQRGMEQVRESLGATG